MSGDGHRVLVRGVVQGVGFRPFVYRIAHQHGLGGSVRNLGNAGVEILVAGPDRAFQAFLQSLSNDAPPLARIDELEVSEVQGVDESEFVILASTDSGDGAGQLPPDVATCDACVTEILGDSRFHGYWATSCTDCGPRFTVIEALPYDRPTTSMVDFPMCDACASEYGDPLDRRYHAQTTACETCGPMLRFDGDTDQAIPRAVEALRQGEIVAIKGIGGTHLACDASNENAVNRLRHRLGRSEQPFALMAREEMLQDWVDLLPQELDELRGMHRPILVSRMAADAERFHVAPGLHTLGVMLPYSGLHHLLLQTLRAPLVMTSANTPGQPMLIENDRIVRELASVADHTLLHDRKIVARCDDSVERLVAGRFVLLRRSRGYVPQGLDRQLGDEPILALGPESDLTFALYDRGRVTPSQHIGNVDDLETLGFLREAVDHLIRLTRCRKPSIIACDAHPRFLTTQLAEQLADETGARIVRVQHHVAHLVSAMVEHDARDGAVGIILDGYGYGADGSAWGGEILVAADAVVERFGSLQPVRLPGGDLAARAPLRVAASLLDAADVATDAIVARLTARGFRPAEADVLMQQIRSGVNAPYTTSAGRFLDAVAAWLDVCRSRTYEGEPAMRLEAAAARGNPRAVFPKILQRNARVEMDTPALFAALAEMAESERAEDVAATAQAALAWGVAEMAMTAAKERGLSTIVVSGGVAYNDAIVARIQDLCEREGYRLLTQSLVPCGDGGVSLGQAGFAGWKFSLDPGERPPNRA